MTKKTNTLSSTLRKGAKNLKKAKEAIALAAVSKLVAAIETAQKESMPALNVVKAILATVEAAGTLLTKLIKSSQLQSGFVELIANAIQDVGNRVNELANLSEMAETDEEFSKDIQAAVDAWANLRKTMDEAVAEEIKKAKEKAKQS